MAKNNAEAQIGAELENDVVTTEPTEKKTSRKEWTAEDAAVLEAGIAKLREFGVSEKMAQILLLAAVWHDKENNAAMKETTIEAFGGSDEFKAYITGEFLTELQIIQGLQKVASTLNNIKSFYTPRESKAKAKLIPMVIESVAYLVNAEYRESDEFKALSREEKIEALKNHPDTKINPSVEVL